MKLKSTFLAAALLLSGFAASAQAADQRVIYNSKGQVLAVVRDADAAAPVRQAPSGPTHYIASPSGKGGAVTVAPHAAATSVAVHKSHNTDSCCAKR